MHTFQALSRPLFAKGSKGEGCHIATPFSEACGAPLTPVEVQCQGTLLHLAQHDEAVYC